MVRIVSGIIALGWEWQNWKKLQPNSDNHTKDAILGQQEHWLQWLDRVMDRVNETQPPGDEVRYPPSTIFLFLSFLLKKTLFVFKGS